MQQWHKSNGGVFEKWQKKIYLQLRHNFNIFELLGEY
jgi:hypothetical protein